MIAAKRLGRYRVGDRIGTGGVADVFVADVEGSEGFGKQVVLKCLRPHVADLPEVVQSLIDEAQLARRLQHGNIVQVIDFEVDDGVPFVVMEFVDGCTLTELSKDLARRDEPLPTDAVLTIAERVAAALDYAHRLVDDDGLPMSIVHRDVKPSNILLSRDGLVKLADFGVAKVAQRGRETLPGVLKGTPNYWAPEQAAGDPVDARTDVFGLGMVLRELLTTRAADDDPVRTSLLDVADACVADSQGDRLPSMRALLDRLRDWSGQHKVHPSGEAIATLVRRAKRDKPAAVRVALDSALLSTPKGDATRQHVVASSTAVPATASSRRRIVGLLIAVVAIVAVVALWGATRGSDAARDAAVASAQPSTPPPSTPPPSTPPPSPPPPSPLQPSTPPPSTLQPDPPRTTRSTPSETESEDAAVQPSFGSSTTAAGTSGGDGSAAETASQTAAGRPVAKASTKPTKPRKGLIKVNTLPWAEVEIDGKPYGRVPIEASLRAGRHRVVLRNPTLGTKRTVINVIAGEAVSVTRWPN